jgi:hypothetical protein
MKKALTNAILIVAGAGLPYLLGVFGAASFDITQWDPAWRVMIGLAMAFLSGTGICLALGMGSDNNRL